RRITSNIRRTIICLVNRSSVRAKSFHHHDFFNYYPNEQSEDDAMTQVRATSTATINKTGRLRVSDSDVNINYQ
ncbi:TPA: hypothetical protein ACJH4Q_004845, partial [Escherichia coli]